MDVVSEIRNGKSKPNSSTRVYSRPGRAREGGDHGQRPLGMANDDDEELSYLDDD